MALHPDQRRRRNDVPWRRILNFILLVAAVIGVALPVLGFLGGHIYGPDHRIDSLIVAYRDFEGTQLTVDTQMNRTDSLIRSQMDSLRLEMRGLTQTTKASFNMLCVVVNPTVHDQRLAQVSCP